MNRAYVIVADLNDNRVIKVAESPPVTSYNVGYIAKAVGDFWYKTLIDFPPPNYNIYTYTVQNLESVQKNIPTLHGWELVKIELLDP
jgi:hypothetical protein